MYYTVFKKGTKWEHRIIHRKPKEQYSEEPALFSFPEFFTVKEKPSFKEAQIIFKICSPGELSGASEGETEEIKERTLFRIKI